MSTEATIALAALVVSVISLLLSLYATRLARYQIRGHQREEERLKKADIKLRLQRAPDQFVIYNDGGAPATQVDVRVSARKRSQNPIGYDGTRKLPLSILGPGDECGLNASVFWEADIAFDATITWRDPDGKLRKTDQTVYPVL